MIGFSFFDYIPLPLLQMTSRRSFDPFWNPSWYGHRDRVRGRPSRKRKAPSVAQQQQSIDAPTPLRSAITISDNTLADKVRNALHAQQVPPPTQPPSHPPPQQQSQALLSDMDRKRMMEAETESDTDERRMQRGEIGEIVWQKEDGWPNTRWTTGAWVSPINRDDLRQVLRHIWQKGDGKLGIFVRQVLIDPTSITCYNDVKKRVEEYGGIVSDCLPAWFTSKYASGGGGGGGGGAGGDICNGSDSNGSDFNSSKRCKTQDDVKTYPTIPATTDSKMSNVMTKPPPSISTHLPSTSTQSPEDEDNTRMLPTTGVPISPIASGRKHLRDMRLIFPHQNPALTPSQVVYRFAIPITLHQFKLGIAQQFYPQFPTVKTSQIHLFESPNGSTLAYAMLDSILRQPVPTTTAFRCECDVVT